MIFSSARITQGLAILCVFGLGGAGGWYYAGLQTNTSSTCASTYHFVSNYPNCDTYDTIVTQLATTQTLVNDKVNEYVKNGSVSRISVFERDLNTRRWLSVNDNAVYAPASLMKAAIMVAYYKYSEIDPSVLSTRLTYKGTADVNADQELYDNSNPLVSGRAYTTEELIEKMMIYSDNNAAKLLIDNINPSFLEKVALDLGIKVPANDDSGTEDFMTAKSYAGTFRILYTASYLNRDFSEKALSIMSRSTFSDGVRAAVPKNVPVTEKYGERTVYNNNTVAYRELHECGIVYAERGPYSFCIMTEGDNFETLKNVIQSISKILYEADGSGN